MGDLLEKLRRRVEERFGSGLERSTPREMVSLVQEFYRENLAEILGPIARESAVAGMDHEEWTEQQLTRLLLSSVTEEKYVWMWLMLIGAKEGSSVALMKWGDVDRELEAITDPESAFAKRLGEVDPERLVAQAIVEYIREKEKEVPGVRRELCRLLCEGKHANR